MKMNKRTRGQEDKRTRGQGDRKEEIESKGFD